MKTRLKLFLYWGIRFDKKPYEIPEQSARKVHYADKRELETAIITRYPSVIPDPMEYTKK